MKQLEESKITVSGINYKTVYTPDNGQLGLFRLSPGTSRELQYGYIQSNGGAFYYDVKTKQGNTNAKNIAALQNSLNTFETTVGSKLPIARKATLLSTGWKEDKTTAIQSDVDDDQTATVIVSPTIGSMDNYIAFGIKCVGAVKHDLVFSCESIPTSDIEVYIMVFNNTYTE